MATVFVIVRFLSRIRVAMRHGKRRDRARTAAASASRISAAGHAEALGEQGRLRLAVERGGLADRGGAGAQEGIAHGRVQQMRVAVAIQRVRRWR